MTDRHQRIVFSPNGDSDESERFGAYDDFAATGNRPDDFVPGLVSLGFIKSVIWRGARFWIVTAIVGMIVGLGLHEVRPHEYQATASILITHGPYEDPQTAANDNQAIAKTPAVAELAVHELGLQQAAGTYLNTYTATSITDRLMLITGSAPSPSQAVLWTAADAKGFLEFRANQMRAEQNLLVGSLQQQISQAKQRLSSINGQISQLSSQPVSSDRQSQISKLQGQQTTETATLDNLQQAVINSQTTTEPALAQAIQGSVVLNVAALHNSRLKPLITYAAVGLILGLALGLAFVVVRALVSDRLRRRDDIAYALDAPVKLSVGKLRVRRWLPSLPGRGARQDVYMKRIVLRLQGAVPRSSQGPAGLAIVAVDNEAIVAHAVAALAASCVSQGHQVVMADLSAGAQMARLFGVKGPGTHAVSRQGVNSTLVVPDRDDPTSVGPLRAITSPAWSAQAGDALAASYASADVLFSLVTLDPALGGDYLATWATNAVVMVSAGQSSAEKIHAVGEMIRLAGTRLDSVILIGADKSDKSLGLTRAPDEQVGVGILGR